MKQLDSEMNRRRSLEEGEDRGQDQVSPRGLTTSPLLFAFALSFTQALESVF
jgi:hypothetical protein